MAQSRRFLPTLATGTLALVAVLPSSPLLAADACSAFKWDVSREVALFRQTPVSVMAGNGPAGATEVEIGRLYALDLHPQEQVKFEVSTSKRMLSDGAYAGLLKLRVAQAGDYRVAIDAGFWLDVVHEGRPLQSLDFNGSQDCAGPRKIVVYHLPADADLFVQLSAVSGPHARITITRVPDST